MTKKTKLSCYEPLPNERQDSFEKFIIYRNLPTHERSLTKAAEQIAMNKDEQSVKKLKTSLGNLCTKWCWVERVKIYDADQQLKIIKKRNTTFDQLSNILLDNVEGLIKYANNLLGEVIKNPVKDNGEPYSLITRIKMSKDVSALLKEAHELLCNLCGRPSTYTSMAVDGLIGINADVTTEHKGFENLIEAFDAGKKQWDKNKE